MPDASPACDVVPKSDGAVTGALPTGDEVNNDILLTGASPDPDVLKVMVQ